ncbi:I78 family peptidase inhibitor [Paracoccus sp. N5]|uniref:I78 family peptidase inhibitor n=1 Tax=Paracoccus sp. N5 TaxID=1101189 RepID=UPI000371E4EE|nr:I78 family peptidase inhibitor [Paracoccus sp. N5]
MKPILPVAMLIPLLAAGCVPEPAPPEPTPPAEDSCGAGRYLGLVGQSGVTISIPADQAYRSYKTGDPVTMDYNPNRLNFEHDKTGKLVRVSCG